ncbi:MAG: hypothetical protein QOG02_645, partial [Gaiellales bacterium]|nr:hypothetical protein [Gaiellales bacterium]
MRLRLAAAALIGLCLPVSGCLGGGSSSSVGAPPPTGGGPPDTAPLVTTDGTRFVDRSGNTVVLRGVDVHTLDPAVYDHAADLGVNFVRVAVPWSDYQPAPPTGGVPSWDEGRLAQLDALVAFCAANHIQVLLDL